MKNQIRATSGPPTYRRRAGFTLVELLIVIVIMGILLTYAIPSFTRLMNSQNAQNARDALVWMANRARARAVERGQAFRFVVDPTNNRAYSVRSGGSTAADTIQTIQFASEHNATLTTSTGNSIVLCFSPRGYAFNCDANSPSVQQTATLTHAGKTAVAAIKPLGQVERQ